MSVLIIFAEPIFFGFAARDQIHFVADIFSPPILAEALPPTDFNTSAAALDIGITRPAFETGSTPKLSARTASYKSSPKNRVFNASGIDKTAAETAIEKSNAILLIFIAAPPLLPRRIPSS